MFSRKYDIEIFMKSGNCIKLFRIKELEIEYRGNQIESLAIRAPIDGRKLMVQSVDLSQIEAIVQTSRFLWF